MRQSVKARINDPRIFVIQSKLNEHYINRLIIYCGSEIILKLSSMKQTNELGIKIIKRGSARGD